ncbi:MAG: FimB/Mfa2 family fimbrial subunit [Prevotella sp.]|nr:FimB/Mfa2 family fimbrial subunit [Prevotella sp.]
MKRNITIYCLLALATILGLSACSEPSNSIPAGMGQVEIILTAPYHKGTRASGDLLDPVSDNEMIHAYWVAFVKDDDNENVMVKELIQGDVTSEYDGKGAEEHSFTFFLPPGNYKAFAFANLSTEVFNSLGIEKDNYLPDLATKTLATTNGWTGNIPMTSHTGGQAITVVEAENQSFEIELIRTMAKMEFTFFNNTQQNMDIVGFEISPLAKDNYVSLLEPETPAILTESETTAYSVNVPLFTNSPNLPTDSELAAPIFYVNETNASAISTEEPNKNQYSIRIKAKRYLASGTTGEVEFRYGLTVNSEDGGFDYIRRNDWIKIPIRFNDWTFRMEALPFPPIAGFQARVLSADALSITFNSGGYIFLRPMFRRNDDPKDVWRGFDDSNVTFKLTGEYTEKASNVVESIDTNTGTGIVLTGDLNIFEQRFVQLESGDIVGKLTNDDDKNGQVTVTIKLILDDFAYQFNYNILKQ